MSYMENIGEVLQAYSKKAFKYGCAKAWDNRKGKAWKRCTSRGKVYRRLINQEWQTVTSQAFKLVEDFECLEASV